MVTKTEGALLWRAGVRAGFEIGPIEIDPPTYGEVRVKLAAAGLCHSDYHYDKGDGLLPFSPLLGGHEGSGYVDEIGPGVTELSVGDRVITTFMPACGTCRWCVGGRGNLCDRGANLLAGVALDGTHRIHADGEKVGPMTFLGTFSPYVVCPVASLIRIEDGVDTLSHAAAAVTSCAVPTGWGTAVHVAGVSTGDTVVVIGTGGVGMNAVQGARSAGAARIVAVDPVAWKREVAYEFGATDDAPSAGEAIELVRELTSGVMADKVVVTVGVVDGALVQMAVDLVSKGGTVAIAGVAKKDQQDAKLGLYPFVMSEKTLRGGLYGGRPPRELIPKLLQMYRSGKLKLEELVTRTYRLEEINQGYADMEAGRNLRGVILFD